MEKLLVCDALDERDFARKKILTAIKNCKLVTARRDKDEKMLNGKQSYADFEKEAKAEYQSIKDMIERWQRLDIAITESNAKTMIKTRSGKEMTVAAAIALRKSMTDGLSENTTDFMGRLLNQMTSQYCSAVTTIDNYNSKADAQLEEYKKSLLGKNSDKQLTEDDLAIVEKMVAGLRGVMVDPIGIEKEIKTYRDKYETLSKELDTAIKVSNATTYIEF